MDEHAPVVGWQQLSDDLLLSVAAKLETADYARLRACSHGLRLLFTTAWYCRVSRSAAASLEELAVSQAADAVGDNRVDFEGMSTELRDGNGPVIDRHLAVLSRFPQLTLRIDAHTGRHAPTTFAGPFTLERAREVSGEFVSRGLSESRVRAFGWGKTIAVRAGWQAGRESARAELYFEFGGASFPPRPDCYAGQTPYAEELSSEEEDESSAR